jgi:PAS domain S-box-containing protein
MLPRILIVEDEQITAEDLRDILTEMGYFVIATVASGRAAISHAEKDQPDLALMDIRIKGEMDGTATAAILRQRFNIPVVYLTAHADRETLERAKVAAPLGYITKPFKLAELHASIEIALHKHKEDLKAQERAEVLSATLRSVGVGVISLSRDERVAYFNPAAETWTGWSSADAVGRPIEEVFPLLDERTGERIEAPVAPVLAGQTGAELRSGVLLLARDGMKRPIEGSVAPIRGRGETTGAVIAFGNRGSAGHRYEPDGADDGIAFGIFKMVAVSPAMKQLLRFARRVAESEASTILLEGESGTGKDVIAHFMHHFGTRRDRPFVALNCAAIPETLLESELFGYEKGAFTDARSPKPGILEMATGGTVFLDEIGEMPLLVQAKMLRVLEEQTFRRLGGVRDIHVDLRVVAASNRHLADAVAQGRFRLDLYYRLNVIQVMLPPLRERKEDVFPLAKFFVKHYNDRFKRSIEGITTAAVSVLAGYDWPGNVRELRNTIERAVLLEESDWIQPSSLRLDQETAVASEIPVAEERKSQVVGAKAVGTLEESEKRLLLDALEKTGWNQTRAAMLLGISRDTLRYKVKKYNLPRPADLAEGAAE